MYYLTFYNAPFPHRDMHVIPPCSIQDGFNHAIFMDSSHSNFSMLSMMLKYDDGSFFKKIESEEGDDQFEQYIANNENTPFEHKRVTEYEIIPDQEFIELCRNPENNIKYGKFSIDGEEYPIDHYKGKVLNKVFDVYSL